MKRHACSWKNAQCVFHINKLRVIKRICSVDNKFTINLQCIVVDRSNTAGRVILM
jgi:hypothetical protein